MSGRFARRAEHPYRLTHTADLPADLRQLAEEALGANDPVETIFVIPSQITSQALDRVRGMHRVPEQALLFTRQGVLHVKASGSTEHQGETVYVRGDSLLYARLSLVLLYGRLELCSAENGCLKKVMVTYNTVGHAFLQPVLQQFLKLTWEPNPAENLKADLTAVLLEKLNQRSLKFRNGLQIYALQPDERLLGFVFQPRVVQTYLRIFQRVVVPATLLALSEQELILIDDGLSSVSSYGWNFHYYPRRGIADIAITPQEKWQVVRLSLYRDGVRVDHYARLENAAAQEWQALWEQHGWKTPGRPDAI